MRGKCDCQEISEGRSSASASKRFLCLVLLKLVLKKFSRVNKRLKIPPTIWLLYDWETDFRSQETSRIIKWSLFTWKTKQHHYTFWEKFFSQRLSLRVFTSLIKKLSSIGFHLEILMFRKIIVRVVSELLQMLTYILSNNSLAFNINIRQKIVLSRKHLCIPLQSKAIPMYQLLFEWACFVSQCKDFCEKPLQRSISLFNVQRAKYIHLIRKLTHPHFVQNKFC